MCLQECQVHGPRRICRIKEGVANLIFSYISFKEDRLVIEVVLRSMNTMGDATLILEDLEPSRMMKSNYQYNRHIVGPSIRQSVHPLAYYATTNHPSIPTRLKL